MCWVFPFSREKKRSCVTTCRVNSWSGITFNCNTAGSRDIKSDKVYPSELLSNMEKDRCSCAFFVRPLLTDSSLFYLLRILQLRGV